MSVHPPWLRFQAYVVGLPKTGSTSVATLFGRYRSAHEWELQQLIESAIRRRNGELDDEAFLRATGERLVPASLEMDSATCHHLYADLLCDRFPSAVFLHTVRDVLSWTSSLLDMMLRKRIARRFIQMPYSVWERDYLASVMAEGTYVLDPDDAGDDRAALAPLMRYWAAHLREMAGCLPADRCLRVRVNDLQERLPEIANLVGLPVETLRTDLVHANRSPLRFDRCAAFDSDALRAAYEQHCADLMAEMFPEQHAAWVTHRQAPELLDWKTYLAEVERWVKEAVERHGPKVAR